MKTMKSEAPALEPSLPLKIPSNVSDAESAMRKVSLAAARQSLDDAMGIEGAAADEASGEHDAQATSGSSDTPTAASQSTTSTNP